jgi:hypothetical protein
MKLDISNLSTFVYSIKYEESIKEMVWQIILINDNICTILGEISVILGYNTHNIWFDMSDHVLKWAPTQTEQT